MRRRGRSSIAVSLFTVSSHTVPSLLLEEAVLGAEGGEEGEKEGVVLEGEIAEGQAVLLLLLLLFLLMLFLRLCWRRQC